jgi:hypothetical protein
MKTRLIATLSALSLSAFAGVSANADEATSELAWQQPGYVTEVVIVTASRPQAPAPAAATDGVLAWQEPGYVEEVVIVKASRREVLAAAFWTEAPPPVRFQPHMGTAAK